MTAQISGPSRSATAEIIARFANAGRDDPTIAVRLGITVDQVRGLREEFSIPPGETRWSHGHQRPGGSAEVAATAGDELRVRIHAHLRQHPGLTAYELARVLQLPNPKHGGQATVRRLLIRMETDGEAVRTTGPKDDGDHRPTARWRAT